ACPQGTLHVVQDRQQPLQYLAHSREAALGSLALGPLAIVVELRLLAQKEVIVPVLLAERLLQVAGAGVVDRYRRRRGAAVRGRRWGRPLLDRARGLVDS